ncbi:MAG: hypothetical protein QOH89_2020 [Pseudonocardiales bacterium]|jgi:quercetin dioxygenase-like cupin family protein|nr:hypothetical protein [Pseudonocardiales bacterium]MDT4941958.1 hypothetical protein [Pseudonocardiales bacterium]
MFRKHSRAPGARVPVTDLSALVRSVAADERLWLPRVELPSGAERWWTRLPSGPGVDLWLLTWLPGHSTDLHDHGDSAAAFTVVRGRLTELRQDAQGRLRAVRRSPGSVTALAPGVVHDVHGSGREPAVSIHAYSPRLQTMNYYECRRDGQLRLRRSVRSTEPELESA